MSNLQKTQQHSPTHTSARSNKPDQKSKATRMNPVQTLSAPEAVQHEDVLAAQQQVGNQVVQRAIDHNKRRNKVTDENGNLRSDLEKSIQQKRGSGSPLPDSIQKDVSRKFGRSFTDVRLHTDDKADKLSRTISARAFTIGSDIFFKNGVFEPGSSQGRETLIHELTHVVQQAGGKGGGGRLKLGAPDTAMEKEAEKIGKRNGQAKIAHAPAAADVKAVQRKMSVAPAGDAMEGEADQIAQQVHRAAPTAANAGAGGNRQLQAQAYAGGNEAHFAPAQEQHLPHEAWHVAQQRQGRVDPTLQMQSEEEEVQMQSEEEEIQMQSEEEEEVQMQPDSSGAVVQRTLEEDLQKQILMRNQLGGRKNRNEAIEKIETKNTTNALKKDTIGDAKISAFSAKNKAEALGAKGKEMGIGSEKNLKKLGKLDAGRDKEFKSRIGDQLNEEKKDRHTMSRNKLMDTIKNQKSSPEAVKEAQEQLDMMHKRSKSDTFKAFFTPGATTKSYSEQASESRKKGLKEAARSGDTEAFKKYKSEKAEKAKNSTGTKIKGALGSLVGKIGGAIGGAVKNKAKAQLGEYKDHFMGPSAEKDDKADASSSKGTDGGGGGGGGGGVTSMISELYQENKSLKEKIKSLEEKDKVKA